MTMSWIRTAAIFGFLGVALGAFGAHGLRGRIPEEMLSVYRTGVLYHLIHAVALLGVAIWGKLGSMDTSRPAYCFVAGIVLFSGSLYLMAFTGIKALGIITPVGGLSFLAGWVLVATQKD